VTTKLLLEYTMIAETLVAVGTTALILRKRLVGAFSFVAAFLGVFALEMTVSIITMFFRRDLGIPLPVSYHIYFYTHVIGFFVEHALLLLVVYGVFRSAMKPLHGLLKAGNVIFRWVCGVSLALSIGLAIAPHSTGSIGSAYFATLMSQVQQGISVLTLCLLLFVCFAIRYLGLTYRSHIFGVSLGLGIMSTGTLIQAAWYSTHSAQTNLYSPIYLFSAIGSCAALLTWGAYFAMPEPERKMVLLPTTSPFFLWNRISEALGDEPGFVAISGFKPDMLAPAELAVLTATSRRVREREAQAAYAYEEFEQIPAVLQAQAMTPMAIQR
jgi:hypothetical protein